MYEVFMNTVYTFKRIDDSKKVAFWPFPVYNEDINQQKQKVSQYLISEGAVLNCLLIFWRTKDGLNHLWVLGKFDPMKRLADENYKNNKCSFRNDLNLLWKRFHNHVWHRLNSGFSASRQRAYFRTSFFTVRIFLLSYLRLSRDEKRYLLRQQCWHCLKFFEKLKKN